MPSRIVYQVPPAFTPMVPGDFIVQIAKAALDGVGAGTVGGQKQQCKAGMLPQPVPDGSGFMDFVVVGYHLNQTTEEAGHSGSEGDGNFLLHRKVSTDRVLRERLPCLL